MPSSTPDNLDLYFEPDPFSPTATLSVRSLPTKPADVFTTPPLAPNTIFYLSITSPHTDTHTLHGPATSFQHLLPRILDIVSNSPKAIDKLDMLREIEDVWGEKEVNLEFAERGFGCFVVDGQRGVYTVLRVLREINKDVYDTLPSPVYTVTAHGPLKQVAPGVGEFKGMAGSSVLVGTYVGRREAREKAQEVMAGFVKGLKGVTLTETWEQGKGGGMVMAMGSGVRWEVRIGYEDQVLRRAREELEREGESVGWRF
ncbi:hypothetical protein FB567DRAFT_605001 [Paraphoma chrysanthemicola]|uniref:Uncharacterized protein n=1 Tax=Paraphoma chrysanthemicola TaxID=798071 RepID=A0A8K0R4J9_9PLEO|nr:hypothetical protein FB567DRAFT_605001 [Paraphoma chrysanthemicola]